jgi:hypothetical protein
MLAVAQVFARLDYDKPEWLSHVRKEMRGEEKASAQSQASGGA